MAKAKKQNFSNSLNLQPQSTNQDKYIKAIEQYAATVGHGLPGSGKTYIASTMAAQALIDHRIDNIYLTRSARSISSTLGYGPGTIEEKLAPWMVPYTKTLRKHLPTYDKLVEQKIIQVVAFEHLQGYSIENSYILLDEAQHIDPFEMKMFLTRLGTNTKAVVSGDINQARTGHKSGLAELVNLIHDPFYPEFGNNIGLVHFDNSDDIIRSDFCRAITVGYDRYHTTNN